MINVAVLAGGTSPEHDVSIRSGTQVLNALDRTKWRVWPVFLDAQGWWWPADEPLGGEDLTAFPDPGALKLRPGAAVDYLIEKVDVDIVFPALHGKHGEDGTVQGMLELHEVAFVGSGTRASALAMDKIHARQVLQANNVVVAPAYVASTPLDRADGAVEARNIAEAVGFPCFLKVDRSGSSLGVVRASGPEDVWRFLDECRPMGRRFIAERLVSGDEITVPVLGNSGDELQALPPVGIYPSGGADYFTYEAKYQPQKCEEIVPPRGMGSEDIGQVQELAMRCHRSLQCDGLSRTDMIMGDDGPVVLEVNTIPGLTPESLLPKSALAAGIDFPVLIDRLLSYGLERVGVTEVV